MKIQQKWMTWLSQAKLPPGEELHDLGAALSFYLERTGRTGSRALSDDEIAESSRRFSEYYGVSLSWLNAWRSEYDELTFANKTDDLYNWLDNPQPPAKVSSNVFNELSSRTAS